MGSWTATFDVQFDVQSVSVTRDRLDKWGEAFRAAGGTLSSESVTVTVEARDLASALSAAVRLVEGILECETSLRRIAATDDIDDVTRRPQTTADR